MPILGADPGPGSPSGRSRSTERIRQALISGIAITIPLIVTLIVLGFVVNFVSQTLNPVVGVFDQVIGVGNVPDPAIKVTAVLTLLTTILLVGFLAESGSEEGSFESTFDQLMARIPGVGSIYTSFNEMSELLLDSDTDSFQEVKLVEYPAEGSYTVAFLTAETPEVVRETTGNGEMQTLFLPMAPNPVMGGFVIHVSTDRIYDVDLTVEEGIRSIVTSGVATGSQGETALDAEELRDLTGNETPVEGAAGRPPADPSGVDRDLRRARRARYDEAVDPEYASQPADIVERERDDSLESDADVGDADADTPDDLRDERPTSDGQGEHPTPGDLRDERPDAGGDGLTPREVEADTAEPAGTRDAETPDELSEETDPPGGVRDAETPEDIARDDDATDE